ncbi:MAG: HAD-IA family hydrolase [Limnochordales bacterium]|nr:HAD-IA family hydrolase [Limnochordales bacterium]
MPQLIRAVLFDIDGTLLNTEETAISSLQRLLGELRQQEYTYDELIPYFGYTSLDTLRALGIPEEQLEEVLHRWEEYYRQAASHTRFFPGAEELLQELRKRGFLVGVVTSKNRVELEFELARWPQIASLDVHVSADDVERPKPAPDPLLLALRKLGVAPAAAIYVGDTLYDQEAARAAGVAFALAGWGARVLTGLTPDLWLSHPQELLHYLVAR